MFWLPPSQEVRAYLATVRVPRHAQFYRVGRLDPRCSSLKYRNDSVSLPHAQGCQAPRRPLLALAAQVR
jgi:hypothetical protein